MYLKSLYLNRNEGVYDILPPIRLINVTEEMIMVSIFVKFIGLLHGKTGKWNSNVKFDEPITVWTLIQRIVTDFELEANILIDNESRSIEQKVLVLVNGKEISVLDGQKTRLGDGDLVTIIPISHGG